MKKIVSIGKVILLSILFILGTTNICLADVYVQPIEPIDSPFIENELITINGVENLFKISFIIVIIMNVILVIGLICLLIAKLNKSEELFRLSPLESRN